jgi:hypothetical protein
MDLVLFVCRFGFCRAFFLILIATDLLLATSNTMTAPSTLKPLLEIKGGWQVFFDSESSTLECRHPVLGIRLAGPLSFTAEQNGQRAKWKLQFARDFAPQRLTLIDENNNVQGYLVIDLDAARLGLKVQHRPPHLYRGKLEFNPVVRFGSEAFACRSHVTEETPVVQMASGPADSFLNDSLFDPNRDLMLCFGGQKVELTTQSVQTGHPITFQARLTALVHKADASTISLDLRPDYYHSRYVPRYRLIDRKRCPSPPTGWMSWNVYFDTAGEKENLEEALVGARFLKPFGLQIWSIESWQENSPRLPVSDFFNLGLKASPEKFPHGMKWLAEQIRSLGFRPGIWTVPWGTGDESFYQAHQKWFLHDSDGKPLSNWNGRYVLDPSQAEVRRQMEEAHHTMAFDWGYEFFKIDGMSGRDQGYSAHFFERPEIRAAFRQPVTDPYSLCIEALRRGIGPDSIFLACQGHYTGPEVAWADAARLGADIVEPNQPPHWANYLNQARITLSQLFTHNLVWYNDPDTLLVGEFAPLNEARIATTVVALPGQLTFFGDKLSQLPVERMRLLQQVLPVCDVHPLDLSPLNALKPIWDLKVRRPFGTWDVASLFNWGEMPDEVRMTFADLGLDEGKNYLLYEFWSEKFLGVHRGNFSARIEGHSNLLLAVHEQLDHPQFLSTNRHVSQGGVELSTEEWNPSKRELLCAFKLVENDPLTAVFHIPSAYEFTDARAEGAIIENLSAEKNPTISVVLRRSTAGAGRLFLTFSPSRIKP